MLNTVSDTSAISERIFNGQFTRYTIQLELQDAFLFSIPYKKNWKLYIDDEHLLPDELKGCLEISNDLEKSGIKEPLNNYFSKKV